MAQETKQCGQIPLSRLDRMTRIGFLLILLNAIQTGFLAFLVYEIEDTQDHLSKSLEKVQKLEQRLDSLQSKIRRHFE
ncbi:hypothetical protein [Helicobacter felis]|uniref:Uncharacterized protein n=1 Tax=Helicobacter felis (strain ATCC 49179 / CCUG 28539 / NCTC 12436 / CS1) TaxID=936155 RepID=E7AC57_HELFC|nr:hypothetical protein [Helicobacter felis]CBY82139.1 unnamed protein product [Helicobacter felis ATCC 49179]